MRISDWISDVCFSDLMLELCPDLLELGLDHRRRHREIVAGGELIEQLALHVRAREAIVLLLDLALEQPLQLIEALEPERGREFLVDHRILGGAHGLDFQDRKSVVQGKSVEVRVDLGGWRNNKKKK